MSRRTFDLVAVHDDLNVVLFLVRVAVERLRVRIGASVDVVRQADLIQSEFKLLNLDVGWKRA